MSERLKIAFITGSDPLDKTSWSGIHYYASRALEKHCGTVVLLGPHRPEGVIFMGKVISKLGSVFMGKRFDYVHSLMLARTYGRYFSKKLKQRKFDMIFCSAASTETAFLETDLPVFYLADSTMARMLDYYPAYTNLSENSRKQALEVEQRGINKATHLLYASEWAAASARNDFKAPASKTHVIPLGANVDEVPSTESILQKRTGDALRLLFLGVQWERKGGNTAFDTLKELNTMGIKTELTVCGCVPPAHLQHPDLKVIPFLNKNDATQRDQFTQLLLNSDLLILPTKAECFGLVFCEASAYGIPSITTDTGGVSSAVHEGVNGHLMPLNAGGKEYAQKIAGLWRDKNSFSSMVKSSRALYDSTLNWDSWGQQVKMLMDKLSF